MERTITIDGRPIGPAHPPYVVAEISGNHNGELSRARQLVAAAAQAGASAVKLQTYTADTITLDHDGPEFTLREGLWAGRRLYDLYEQAHTPWEWHAELFALGREVGITVFSAPFDPSAVELLESLGAPAYKIASFEIVDVPLIDVVARTGKPMILSTGMATLDEIAEAVDAARAGGCRELALFHCISGYPTPPDELNLLAIQRLAEEFQVPVGLSDHTLGTTAAVAAAALGAALIEKHFTVRRADGGPDAAFSAEPDELAELCTATATAWSARGDGAIQRTPSEADNARLRRSLYVVEDVEEGQLLTTDNIRSIRPGGGLPPKYLWQVVGRPASRALRRGTPLELSMVGGTEERVT